MASRLSPLAGGDTPSASFHAMNVVLVDDREAALAQGSPARKREQQQFACEFDPSLKSARLLVLRFDAEGDAAFEEMSRVDILRLAQDAATPVIDKLSADAAAAQAQTLAHAREARAASAPPGQAPYGTICDVQVRPPPRD